MNCRLFPFDGELIKLIRWEYNYTSMRAIYETCLGAILYFLFLKTHLTRNALRNEFCHENTHEPLKTVHLSNGALIKLYPFM